MKFTGSNFKLLATGKGGAILDRGDGEIIVPSIIQPVIELPSPMTSANPTGDVVSSRSFIANGTVTTGGSVSFPDMAAGIWVIDINGHYVLIDTGAVGEVVALDLVDPAGSGATIWTFDTNVNAGVMNLHGDLNLQLRLHTIEPGWNLLLRASASATATSRTFVSAVHTLLLP